ncbi:conserved hypothetical protein [Gloeothece citriformis PCC 7424]|uniref:Uncharacterized protein n=2 Tax=Gloeothece TaxID=28070 RepID=B7KE71_GLOC7|nr:conserved hypothetical protein [Gloeothece citriformis PCC 7424]
MTKLLPTLKRWSVALIVCVAAIAALWGGTFNDSTSAMAAPDTLVIATTDTGDEIQRDNKNFVRDAAEKVKETANKNANRVERATDDDSFIQRKAQRDAARIEKRANEDAARTQKAIDDNVNAVERTIDNIKDVFSP